MRKCQIRTHAALRRGSQTFFIAGDSLGGISVFFRNGLYLIYPYLSVFILHLYMEVDGLKYEANWSDSRVTVSAAHFGTRHHARQSACYRRPRRCQGGWSVLRPDLDVQYFVIITILRCTSIYFIICHLSQNISVSMSQTATESNKSFHALVDSCGACHIFRDSSKCSSTAAMLWFLFPSQVDLQCALIHLKQRS